MWVSWKGVFRVLEWLHRYTRWLHTGWPSGKVEAMPEVGEDGSTAVPGLYVVGDLAGIPLLKFSAHTGARAVRSIVADPPFQTRTRSDGEDRPLLDLVIVGGGVSGMAAALEAKVQGLAFQVLEASEPFSTIVNFPKGKPIYTYPTGMVPDGALQFSESADVKESLLEELVARTTAEGIQPVRARAESVIRKPGLSLPRLHAAYC